jgi:hypothetical protein
MIRIEDGTAFVDTFAEALEVCDKPGVKWVKVSDKDDERKLWEMAKAFKDATFMAEVTND